MSATSTQTGGVERVCMRFVEPGTYHVALVATSIASPLSYSLLARADAVEATTAGCITHGQLPSAAFVAGLPLP